MICLLMQYCITNCCIYHRFENKHELFADSSISIVCFNALLCKIFGAKYIVFSYKLPSITKGMVCGAGTEAIAGEGMILTAGALDGHVHFICPQLAKEAIASGITTMFGGGTGPATGSNATTCTPGANHIR